MPLLDRLVNFYLRKSGQLFHATKGKGAPDTPKRCYMASRWKGAKQPWEDSGQEKTKKNRGIKPNGLILRFLRWSEWRDLNSRPLDPQSSALPAAPHPDNVVYYTGRFRKMQALFSNFLKKFCKGPSSPQKHWAEGHLLLVYIVAGGAGFTPGRQLGAAPPALLGSLGKEPFLLHQLFQAVPQGQQL